MLVCSSAWLLMFASPATRVVQASCWEPAGEGSSGTTAACTASLRPPATKLQLTLPQARRCSPSVLLTDTCLLFGIAALRVSSGAAGQVSGPRWRGQLVRVPQHWQLAPPCNVLCMATDCLLCMLRHPDAGMDVAVKVIEHDSDATGRCFSTTCSHLARQGFTLDASSIQHHLLACLCLGATA